MVKNTKGGKGSKGLARKHVSSTSSERLRISTDELEMYGCVSKMFGNGMCEITLNDNKTLVGHIRGAFRGRQKHHNLITKSSIVLVGLREWEETRKNCDILYIYDDIQLEILKSLPQVDIKTLIQIKNGFSLIAQSDTDDFIFTNDTDEEVNEMLETVDNFTINEAEEIDMDDI
jgi:initiation factor 1A